MKENKKRINKIIAFVFLIVFVFAVIFIVKTKIQENKNREALEDLAKSANTEAILEQQPSDNSLQDMEEAEVTYTSPIDFSTLQEDTNQDIYAWITIPDTQIDYPVLQSASDDAYYLNYNLDGSSGYPGCIYTEKVNSKEFSDSFTVIYGHNMKDETMFGGLRNYKDSEYFNEHNMITIYTKQAEYTYKVFAAYTYDDRHLLKSFDFTNRDVFQEYLQGLSDIRDMSAVMDKEVELDKDSKILTLSTCIENQPTSRFLVQAVLVEDEE